MQQHSLSRRAPAYGLVMALLGLGFSATTITPATAATSRTTPFGALVTGTLTATGTNTFQLTGSGASNLMGRINEAGNVQITNVDSNGVITDVLTETLTAANGDTLTLHCDEIATPVKPGVLHGKDTWTVVGGTGRFAHATGSGTGSTDADLNRGLFIKAMSGSISFG